MAKKVVKAEIDKKGVLTFLEDEDGVTERDWVILLTSTVFFGGIAIGMFVVILGMFFGFTLPPQYIELIKTMDAPIGIILGGLFAVKGVQTWSEGRKPEKKKEDEYIMEDDL